jgi:N-acetylmuramoyl-L-alanine amidase
LNGWTPTRGAWRAAALLCALALAVPASGLSVAQKKAKARTQFESAEKLRQELNGTPVSERTRRDYSRAIDAYRRVYYIAPTSNRADEAVVAVAELLAEMGRSFSDPKSSHDAISQYEFLAREYPGSRHRAEAQFTIAEIYLQDLDDAEQARAAFADFLKLYPHHRLAAQARDAIAQIDEQAADQSKKDKKAAASKAGSSPPAPARSKPLMVSGIRYWSTPDYTRVVIDLDDEVKYEAGRVPRPDRIFFDLHNSKLAPELVGKSFDVEDGFLKRIRVAQYQLDMARVVLEVDDVSDYSAFLLPNPERLIIDIHGRKPTRELASIPTPPPAVPAHSEAAAAPKGAPPVAKNPPPTEAKSDSRPTAKTAEPAADKAPVKTAESKSAQAKDPEVKATKEPTSKPTYQAVKPHEAQPTADGDRSLIRALGLKIGRIVVDAGHGGHDTGTIGPDGLQEKDLVLDVALRLGKLLEKRMGADVTYTRDDDTFIPLETRTAIANQAEADLFISIHANSSHDSGARGIETYYLNFTSSKDALEVAARENAVSDKSIHELQDLVKKIALKEKIEESREFAGDVEWGLRTGMSAKGAAMRDRGVKKAPFVVLIGANMPSVLAEISFLSNPKDEQKLKSPEYRQKIAEALYKGIVRYANGLSGVKVASKAPKEDGP